MRHNKCRIKPSAYESEIHPMHKLKFVHRVFRPPEALPRENKSMMKYKCMEMYSTPERRENSYEQSKSQFCADDKT